MQNLRLLVFLIIGFLLVSHSNVLAATFYPITDSDMESSDLTYWPHTDIVGGNSSSKSTGSGNGSSTSLKGTSQSGRLINVGWSYEQNIGFVSSDDDVYLSLWYAYLYNSSTSGASGVLYVDIKPMDGYWANIYNLPLTAYNTSRNFGSTTDYSVGANFYMSTTYDIRLRFEGTTGRDNSANIEVWWDDVYLEVVSESPPVVPEPISSTLFLVGGATLGFRHFRKKFKK